MVHRVLDLRNDTPNVVEFDVNNVGESAKIFPAVTLNVVQPANISHILPRKGLRSRCMSYIYGLNIEHVDNVSVA